MIILKKRNCPLCGKNNYKLLFRDKNRREGLNIESNYVKCKKCGMIYLNPILDFKKFKEYDEIYSTKKGYYAKSNHLVKILYFLLEGYNLLFERSRYYHRIDSKKGLDKDGSKKRILDIGCGDGAKLIPYYRMGREVYGVDLSSKSIEQAKKKLPEGAFFCKDLRNAGFKNDFFDMIRADAVLEHIEDPINFLILCRKYLKKNGKLCLYVPNAESFCMKVFGKYNINCWVPFHINFFSEKTARKMLSQAGFQKIKIYYNTPTIYFLLSINQSIASLRKQDKFLIAVPIYEKLLYTIFSPIGWFLNKLKLGEELVIIANK